MLTDEVKDEISVMVRAGFYDQDRIINIFLEEMYAPGDLNADEVKEQIDNDIKKLEFEKINWPSVTDCDKINIIFSNINNNKIVALQNVGNTQSDGYEDSMAVYNCRDDKHEIIGYCYYHGQDLERVIRTGMLFIAFGPIDPNLEEKDGPKIGNIIKDEFEKFGFLVDWNGTFNKRICVKNIIWQKR